MSRDFITDLVKYFPAQIAPALMGFIAIPIVTRLFPAEDYGNYVLVRATVNVLAIIVGWISMSIIRFHPAYERDNRAVEFHATVVKLLVVSVATLAAVFLGILFIFRSYFTSQLWHLLVIGAAVFVLMSGFQVLQHFFRAKRQVNRFTGFQIWHSVAPLGIGIGLVIGFHYGIEGLLWGYVLGVGIAVPLLWKMTVGVTPSIKTKELSGALTKEMAKYGFPLVAGNLAAWILSLSDRYILEFFRDAQEVGVYSASYAISERSILLLVSLFMFASGPLGMNIWEKHGLEKSQEFITRVTRYYLLLCLPAAVGISILAKRAIGILTGPEYHEGYQIVVFVAFGGFFLGLQQRFQTGLTFHKKTTPIMTAIVVSGLLNLGLNFCLVPIYGYIAAAVTTFISYAFYLMAMIVISRRYFVWDFPLRSLGNAIVASIVMGVTVYQIDNVATPSYLINLILCIIVGIVVYLVMLFLLRELQKEEMYEMRMIARKMLRQ
ncbi:flippase [bacterium]|nr:flippase [bacterium]